jgi:hypothetical protein
VVPIVQFPNKNNLYYVKTSDTSQNLPANQENKYAHGFKEIENDLKEADEVMAELNKLQTNKMKKVNNTRIIKNINLTMTNNTLNVTLENKTVSTQNVTVSLSVNITKFDNIEEKNNTEIIFNELNQTTSAIERLYNNPLIKQNLEKFKQIEIDSPSTLEHEDNSYNERLSDNIKFREIDHRTNLRKVPNGPIDLESMLYFNLIKNHK